MNKNIKILGIDYGRSKVGLAISEGGLAEPLKVIRYQEQEKLRQEIKEIVEREKIEIIVVGVSEGEMAEETREFRKRLEKELNIPVEEFDETLTTYEAKELSRQAGINRKKRHEMEDAYAAAIMLQNYIDNRP